MASGAEGGRGSFKAENSLIQPQDRVITNFTLSKEIEIISSSSSNNNEITTITHDAITSDRNKSIETIDTERTITTTIATTENDYKQDWISELFENAESDNSNDNINHYKHKHSSKMTSEKAQQQQQKMIESQIVDLYDSEDEKEDDSITNKVTDPIVATTHGSSSVTNIDEPSRITKELEDDNGAASSDSNNNMSSSLDRIDLNEWPFDSTDDDSDDGDENSYDNGGSGIVTNEKSNKSNSVGSATTNSADLVFLWPSQKKHQEQGNVDDFITDDVVADMVYGVDNEVYSDLKTAANQREQEDEEIINVYRRTYHVVDANPTIRNKNKNNNHYSDVPLSDLQMLQSLTLAMEADSQGKFEFRTTKYLNQLQDVPIFSWDHNGNRSLYWEFKEAQLEDDRPPSSLSKMSRSVGNAFRNTSAWVRKAFCVTRPRLRRRSSSEELLELR